MKAEQEPDFDFVEFIKKTNIKERLSNPSYVGSIYYASELYYICPRREVLININNLVITKHELADDLWCQSLGRAIHSALQNDIWSRQCVHDRVIDNENSKGSKKSIQTNDFSDVFKGNWKCEDCGKIYTGRTNPNDESYFVDEFAINKPEKCDQCNSRSIAYKEVRICNEQIGIVCKVDGFLDLKELTKLATIEFKTVNQFLFRTLEKPRIQDIVQSNIVMKMTNTDWCLIVYVCRGDDRITKALKCFWINHNEEIFNEQIDKVKLIWHGIARKKLPFRMCYGIKDDRAMSCPLRIKCFIEDDF